MKLAYFVRMTKGGGSPLCVVVLHIVIRCPIFARYEWNFFIFPDDYVKFIWIIEDKQSITVRLKVLLAKV